VHRANDAQIVGAAPDIGKDFTDLGAALAELMEGERRRESRAGTPLGFERDRDRLSGKLRERRQDRMCPRGTRRRS
jgi:hypothetical protein